MANYSSEVIKGLKENGEFRISGVGVIKVVDRAARTALNPATGEKINVAARKDLKFTKSKKFIAELNGK